MSKNLFISTGGRLLKLNGSTATLDNNLLVLDPQAEGPKMKIFNMTNGVEVTIAGNMIAVTKLKNGFKIRSGKLEIEIAGSEYSEDTDQTLVNDNIGNWNLYVYGLKMICLSDLPEGSEIFVRCQRGL